MDNPYVPPNASNFESDLGPAPDISAMRPTVVTVFGILNIIFASMGLLCTPFAIAFLFLPHPQAGANPAMDLMMASQGYRNVTIGLTIAGMSASVVELIAGIGLLKMRSWAASAAIWVAVYQLLAIMVSLVSTYHFVVAPMWEKAKQVHDPAMTGGAIGGAIGGLIGTCFGAIYPVLLLFFLTRPHVAEAFRRVDSRGLGSTS